MALQSIEDFLNDGEKYLEGWYREHGLKNKLTERLAKEEAKLKEKWEAAEKAELHNMMTRKRRSTWGEGAAEHLSKVSAVVEAVLSGFNCNGIEDLPPQSSIDIPKVIDIIVRHTSSDTTDSICVLKHQLILDAYRKKPLPSNAPTVQLYQTAKILLSQFACVSSMDELLDSFEESSRLLNKFVDNHSDCSQAVSELEMLLSGDKLIAGLGDGLIQKSQPTTDIITSHCYGRGTSNTTRLRVLSELLKSQVVSTLVGGPIHPILTNVTIRIPFTTLPPPPLPPIEGTDTSVHEIDYFDTFNEPSSSIPKYNSFIESSAIHEGCLRCGTAVRGGVTQPSEIPSPIGPPSPLIEVVDDTTCEVRTQVIMPHAVHDGIIGNYQAVCAGVVSWKSFDEVVIESTYCTLTAAVAVACCVVSHPATAVWLTNNLLQATSKYSEYLLEDFKQDSSIINLIQASQSCYEVSRSGYTPSLLTGVSSLHANVSQLLSQQPASLVELSKWLTYQHNSHTLDIRVPVPVKLSLRVREVLQQINNENEASNGIDDITQLYCGTIVLFRDEMLHKNPTSAGLVPHCVWEDLQHLVVLLGIGCKQVKWILQNALLAPFSSISDTIQECSDNMNKTCYLIYKATNSVIDNLLQSDYISDWETVSNALSKQASSEGGLSRRASRRSIISLSGNRRNSLFSTHDGYADSERSVSARSASTSCQCDAQYAEVISSLTSDNYSSLPPNIASCLSSQDSFTSLSNTFAETLHAFNGTADISELSQLAFAQAIAIRNSANRLKEAHHSDNTQIWTSAAETTSALLSQVVRMEEVLIWSKKPICETLISTVSLLNTEVRRDKRLKERERHATAIQSVWRNFTSLKEMKRRRSKLQSHLPELFLVGKSLPHLPYLRQAFGERIAARNKEVLNKRKRRSEKRALAEAATKFKSQREQLTTPQLLSIVESLNETLTQLSSTREVVSLKCRILKQVLRLAECQGTTSIPSLQLVENHLKHIMSLRPSSQDPLSPTGDSMSPSLWGSPITDLESVYSPEVQLRPVWMSPSYRHSVTGNLLFINSPQYSTTQKDVFSQPNSPRSRNPFSSITKNLLMDLIRVNISLDQLTTARSLCRYGSREYPEEEFHLKDIELDVDNFEKAEPLAVHAKRRYQFKIDEDHRAKTREAHSKNMNLEKRHVAAAAREHRRKVRLCRLTGGSMECSQISLTDASKDGYSDPAVKMPELQLSEESKRARIISRQEAFYQSLRNAFEDMSLEEESTFPSHQLIASPTNECVV